MVILLINNGRRDKKFYETILSRFTENETIIEVRNIPEAKKFLSLTLVGGRSRVDLIIANFDFGSDIQTSTDLIIWLKGSYDKSYYDSSLLLSALPIVLVQSSANSTETDRLLGFDSIIKFSDLDNPNRIKFVIESTIKQWLAGLMSDYDLLRVDPRVPFLSAPIIWNDNCDILARDYRLNPRKLPFLVFQRDIEAAEAAIDNFYNTVRKISASSKPKQEKMYHALLSKYPEFIKGETYDEIIYEKNFSLSSNNGDNYEPDFVRRHSFYKFNKIANILEIKLPNDKFISGSRFHPTLSSRLIRNLSQVKDYQNYFNDRDNYEVISSALGFVPNMSHALLMGRNNERDIHKELLERRLREFGSTDILLIIYDDLIQKREKLLERSSLYKVY